ncbi:unnamed protein product [Gongylonema pulchrum]|uniref:Cytochrome c oxidase assembly protein COX20, mitochondrial n=1 Tax=Gongylonema pulchrum TaxID=637853 RepID=A0A183DN77_9BILA|nr:unnamed protein product [Gongylonema pulchrum]
MPPRCCSEECWGTLHFALHLGFAKENITAYSSIYGMALLCTIVGSIRSLYFVQKHIRKKRLIETSITV